MMEFKIGRHNQIWVLFETALNRPFLEAHQMLFAGGTLASMRYGEYRESLDLDFLCSDKRAFNDFRANFREAGDLKYARDSRITKDRVQSWIDIGEDTPLKADFFYEERMTPTPDRFNGVLCLDPASMMGCKLMACSDRGVETGSEGKDATDIIAIDLYAPPKTFEEGWKKAKDAYGSWLTGQLGKMLARRSLSEGTDRYVTSPELRELFKRHAPVVENKVREQLEEQDPHKTRVILKPSEVTRQELPGSERIWDAIEELHRKNFLTDNALALSGETLTPMKYGGYREVDAIYLVTNDWGGYNQAGQLAKEMAIRSTMEEKSAREFSFQMLSSDGKPMPVHVMCEERLHRTTENFRGIPALDDQSLLEQNLLYRAERGSDPEKNARDTMDLIALAEATRPEEQKKAIESVNEISTVKVRDIRNLVKDTDLTAALDTFKELSDEAKGAFLRKYENLKGRADTGISE